MPPSLHQFWSTIVRHLLDLVPDGIQQCPHAFATFCHQQLNEDSHFSSWHSKTGALPIFAISIFDVQEAIRVKENLVSRIDAHRCLIIFVFGFVAQARPVDFNQRRKIFLKSHRLNSGALERRFMAGILRKSVCLSKSMHAMKKVMLI